MAPPTVPLFSQGVRTRLGLPPVLPEGRVLPLWGRRSNRSPSRRPHSRTDGRLWSLGFWRAGEAGRACFLSSGKIRAAPPATRPMKAPARARLFASAPPPPPMGRDTRSRSRSVGRRGRRQRSQSGNRSRSRSRSHGRRSRRRREDERRRRRRQRSRERRWDGRGLGSGSWETPRCQGGPPAGGAARRQEAAPRRARVREAGRCGKREPGGVWSRGVTVTSDARAGTEVLGRSGTRVGGPVVPGRWRP